MNNRAIVIASGPLKAGISAALTQFVYKYQGEIADFEQYVDMESDPKTYYARMEWSLSDFGLPIDQIKQQLEADIGTKFEVSLDLRIITRPVRIAIMVTKQLPCFYNLVLKTITKEWYADPILVVSNREDMKKDAQRFDIPFHHLPITPENRDAQGEKAIELFKQHDIDLVVLAKYMQIIPKAVIENFDRRIINIHHSMLPAFVGAKPYHQARRYGVKFIGATAHYVTEELDEGPIIVQDVKPITHKKTSDELVALGKSIESDVLSRAVGFHLEHRITLSGRRSIIFE